MKDTCYLIVDRRGVKRMTKRPASLRPGEVQVGVNVEVPKEFFERPKIVATIRVDQGALQPINIDAGVLEAVEEHIRDGLGVNVFLEVMDTNESEEQDG